MNTSCRLKSLPFIHFYRIGLQVLTVFVDGRNILVGLFHPLNRFCTLKEAFEVGDRCRIFKSEKEAVIYMREF